MSGWSLGDRRWMGEAREVTSARGKSATASIGAVKSMTGRLDHWTGCPSLTNRATHVARDAKSEQTRDDSKSRKFVSDLSAGEFLGISTAYGHCHAEQLNQQESNNMSLKPPLHDNQFLLPSVIPIGTTEGITISIAEEKKESISSYPHIPPSCLSQLRGYSRNLEHVLLPFRTCPWVQKLLYQEPDTSGGGWIVTDRGAETLAENGEGDEGREIGERDRGEIGREREIKGEIGERERNRERERDRGERGRGSEGERGRESDSWESMETTQAPCIELSYGFPNDKIRGSPLKVPQVQAVQREHCASVQALARSGDVVLDAQGSVALVGPAPLGSLKAAAWVGTQHAHPEYRSPAENVQLKIRPTCLSEVCLRTAFKNRYATLDVCFVTTCFGGSGTWRLYRRAAPSLMEQSQGTAPRLVPFPSVARRYRLVRQRLQRGGCSHVAAGAFSRQLSPWIYHVADRAPPSYIRYLLSPPPPGPAIFPAPSHPSRAHTLFHRYNDTGVPSSGELFFETPYRPQKAYFMFSPAELRSQLPNAFYRAMNARRYRLVLALGGIRARVPIRPPSFRFPALRSHTSEASWVRFLAESTVFSQEGNLADVDVYRQCWTMPLVGGFSRGSPVPPTLAFWRCSILSWLHPNRLSTIDVESRPNLFTHSFVTSLINQKRKAVPKQLAQHPVLLAIDAILLACANGVRIHLPPFHLCVLKISVAYVWATTICRTAIRHSSQLRHAPEVDWLLSVGDSLIYPRQTALQSWRLRGRRVNHVAWNCGD
ncbi:hypothetical protein PR048_010459 [Dryococelus australis]|uniref:Uncharacterized protein n=1 Tax=Dryococelus australis TaxID=614101 RepID=A0ABQ9I3X0_9NEOP|nr:hypothetical protein PR048_010459 [Dryococelus australis]